MIMFAIAVLICSLCITQSKVITVDNTGNNSDCCVNEGCPCGSFSDALQQIENHTIVNITTPSVSLHVLVRVSNLTNITISGNGATIMCNNSGIVTILYCSNVVMEGVTWDQCGNSNHLNYTHGIGFRDASNISILSTTFQNFAVCNTVVVSLAGGYVEVRNSEFLHNIVVNSSRCLLYSSLFITDMGIDGGIYIFIITGTTFQHNGVLDSITSRLISNSALSIQSSEKRFVVIYLENSTISMSIGLGAYLLGSQIGRLGVQLNKVKITNNSQGGLLLRVTSSILDLLISLSTFADNHDGSLKVLSGSNVSIVELDRLSVHHNEGTFREQFLFGNDGVDEGVGIFLSIRSLKSLINISSCNIYNNIGGLHSIVYIKDVANTLFYQKAYISSSNFTGNIGPALRVSLPTINLEGLIMYEGNSAESGAAVYIEHNTQVSIGEGSTILFINNSASLHGGAIYVDLPLTCSRHGVVFTRLPNNSDVVFINNSAGITGNSMYFSIPGSCDVIRDYNDRNSIVYIPKKFSYSGEGGTQISTSPYQIKICSPPGCDSANTNNCFIQKEHMLGQPINFNATVCDYLNNVAETTQFNMEFIDCNDTYRPFNRRVLAHNGLSTFTAVSVDSDKDLSGNLNITIKMSSVLSHKYKKLTATFSLELSPCHSGFVFDVKSQQCTCYGDNNVIRCREQFTEIKQGYWFGDVFGRRTVSLCPQFYCEFSNNAETRTGFYKLPVNQDGQCSPHRRGPACGECSPGYSLSYDTPGCVSNDKCSAGITVLVVVLTIVYWIIVVLVIFVLMYFINKAPIGYAYGIIYYYSIVDILLGNNLYISNGLFQFTTIVTSFAKLTPQFLGRLCFVQGLSGIDQHFIRFFHAVAVFLLVVAVAIAAKYSLNVSTLVSRCIIRVICLLLLLAYTSLATTSLQLLRPLRYQDVDGVYVYLSPSNKYFSGRHIVYAIVAVCVEIFIVHGFILFLLFEPCLKKHINFIKVKAYLDQLQACYKDEYRWFAAFYLVCRQVIILIVYINSNYDTTLYCLQTFCIITVAIHVWIQPYKSTALNVNDGIILLTMLLVINLSAFNFSRLSTVVIVTVLVIFPLLFSLLMYLKTSLYTSFAVKYFHKRRSSYKVASDTTEVKD